LVSGSPCGHAIQFPEKLLGDLFWDVKQRGSRCSRRRRRPALQTGHYRADGDQTNYPTSPIRRYDALKAMGFI
jgi:hypothetical protein